MTHYIKILPEYFNAVASGRKSFEVRCNDRKYTVGDRLIMQEVDEHGRLSGQSIVCKITYIFSDTEYVKEGYEAHVAGVAEQREAVELWVSIFTRPWKGIPGI